MASTFYSVSISILINGPTGDGFIDNKTINAYRADGSEPTDVAASIAKERANQRYAMMIAKLQLIANFYISGIDTTGADANEAPPVFAFTLESEHGDECIVTDDELTPGAKLTSTAAIKRAIARMLTTTMYSDYQEYYDPTSEPGVGVEGAPTANAVRFGSRIDFVEVGKLANNLTAAEAVISVTKL